jgi:hypothetical protein
MLTGLFFFAIAARGSADDADHLSSFPVALLAEDVPHGHASSIISVA